jgi:hypothetical protein
MLNGSKPYPWSDQYKLYEYKLLIRKWCGAVASRLLGGLRAVVMKSAATSRYVLCAASLVGCRLVVRREGLRGHERAPWHVGSCRRL